MAKIPKYRMVSSILVPIIGPAKSENLINHIKNPYSRWEDRHQCIFVHVPKAAGKAISRSLLDAPNGTGHNKLRNYERNREKYSVYRKVSVIRNPWDRLVSAFFYLRSLDARTNGGAFFKRHIGHDIEFQSFIRRLEDPSYREKILEWEHFTPQKRFLIRRDGQLGVDFIARFESLSSDFETMKALVNPGASDLSRINASKRESYESYYDEKLKAIVQHAYSEDIDTFEYEF
ncbi:sulfotransferase family 2 domain-containing protein [Salinicola peritrichatus]|uniref:sulfotransferase family 2 domain-containing protein n=1 Tax=Salinicola peritrichatus TaxID=1267424 RepID=UPI0013A63D21|nr:sulfotransferase family 2 domain-containing protein [Salinicola peritrichatus]